MPRLEGRPGDAARLRVNNRLIGMATDAHEGRLAPAGWFVRLDRPNAVLSIIKQAEDGPQMVLRLMILWPERPHFRGTGRHGCNQSGPDEYAGTAAFRIASPSGFRAECACRHPMGGHEIVTVELQGQRRED